MRAADHDSPWPGWTFYLRTHEVVWLACELAPLVVSHAGFACVAWPVLGFYSESRCDSSDPDEHERRQPGAASPGYVCAGDRRACRRPARRQSVRDQSIRAVDRRGAGGRAPCLPDEPYLRLGEPAAPHTPPRRAQAPVQALPPRRSNRSHVLRTVPLPQHNERRLSLIHISEPTRRTPISYAVFCLK